jgi:hypothetical protein
MKPTMRQLLLGAVLAITTYSILLWPSLDARARIITPVLIISGICLAFFGFAPIFSQTLRRSLVRKDVKFDKARSGLVWLGVVGVVFFVIGTYRLIFSFIK